MMGRNISNYAPKTKECVTEITTKHITGSTSHKICVIVVYKNCAYLNKIYFVVPILQEYNPAVAVLRSTKLWPALRKGKSILQHFLGILAGTEQMLSFCV